MAEQKFEEKFDWIQLSNELQPEQQTFIEKLWRKTKDNPLVPIGTFISLQLGI